MYQYLDLPNNPETATSRLNKYEDEGYTVLQMMATCQGSIRVILFKDDAPVIKGFSNVERN